MQGQGAGHTDALALAAAELVRVAVAVVRVQADGREQLADAFSALPAFPHVVDLERLGNDARRCHTRVQAGVRILEDHLHPAADAAKRRAFGVRDVLTFEDDAARRRLV